MFSHYEAEIEGINLKIPSWKFSSEIMLDVHTYICTYVHTCVVLGQRELQKAVKINFVCTHVWTYVLHLPITQFSLQFNVKKCGIMIFLQITSNVTFYKVQAAEVCSIGPCWWISAMTAFPNDTRSPD
jgi:hypothetical protein